MNIYLEVFNYSIAVILIGVSIAWVFLIRSMWNTFNKSPFLDQFKLKPHHSPKVSIIIPARNEEEFIERCLSSLIDQDYDNYEIIVIDDRSDDRTSEIIKKMSTRSSKVIYVFADPKPETWIGKNWACIEGYKRSKGELLLFTDADTFHSKNSVSLAVSHLISEDLDALTAIPKMLCLDKWVKITLPVLSTFLHTRFSALRVNDPSKKTGYFFGSFFIIKRQVYETVGTHEGVKSEIVEDGALGKKVKESGFKLKMVRAEHIIEAIWARDKSTLWHALKRLMVPLYFQSKTIAIGIFAAVLFLLLVPFPTLLYSGIFIFKSFSFMILFWSSLVSSLLIYIASILDAKKGLSLSIKYPLLSPIGSFIIIAGFASGIIQANSNNAVRWRGRTYSMAHSVQNSISV